MVTQQAGCLKLLPGTAHMELHGFPQESLAVASRVSPRVFSAHLLAPLLLGSHPDSEGCPDPSSSISRHPYLRDKAGWKGARPSLGFPVRMTLLTQGHSGILDPEGSDCK